MKEEEKEKSKNTAVATKEKKTSKQAKKEKAATKAANEKAKKPANSTKAVKAEEPVKETIAPEEEAPKFKQVKKNKKIYNANEAHKNPRIAKGIKIAVIVGALAIALIISTIFALINMGNQNILKGVSIQGIDVSGLDRNQAVEKLNAMYDEKLATEIKVKYQDYESEIDLKALETSYDVEKAVDQAVAIGRDSNIFVNNYEILSTYLFKKEVPIDFTTNDELTTQTLDDVSAKLPGVVEEPSYYREENTLYIAKGKRGNVVDKEAFKETLKAEIANPQKNEETIELQVTEKDPDPIDVDKIHEEVHTEVQDAYFTKDPFELHPEVEGVDFDVEAAKAIIAAEDKEEYEIPLTITEPKVKLSDMGTEAFPNRLATFSTNYNAGDTDRTTNLRIACQKLNGKVIMPGETFSYNKTLGKRTAQNGYRNGKIYEGGKVVDGIGGGICQISSTLYNAVLMSNLTIVERHNHQFVPSYVGPGRDATVVYGALDFKFKNTRTYPVRLTASIGGGVATVSVYGVKEENEYTFSFSTRTVSTIPFSETKEVNTTVPEGTVIQNGSNGRVTETYITKYLNGRAVSTSLLSRDTYSAMAKIVATGGSQPQTQPTETTAPTQTPNPSPTPETSPTPSSTPPPTPNNLPGDE